MAEPILEDEEPVMGVYYCLTCGPCLRETYECGTVTMHKNIPHPGTFMFDEEDNPQ